MQTTRNSSKPRVVVLGASGHTGRFVLNELRERGAVPIAVAHRFYRNTPGIDRDVDSSDPSSLDRALESADAALNWAGPFSRPLDLQHQQQYVLGDPISTSLPSNWTVADLFETLDAPAVGRGVTIVPAMGLYGGPLI